MDTGSFEALLKADGFQDIETKIYEPKPANGTHRHHYAVRGFVLNGAFTVSVDGVATTYRTGQIFERASSTLRKSAVTARKF